MKKLAIIGASYLQEPLIQKAKSMGIETHVFAWAANDVGEKSADFFYPISIVEKEQILEKCREIGIDGICSIASDLAVIAVNYVAYHMGLVGNSLHSTVISTNKKDMRDALCKNGDSCPKYLQVSSVDETDNLELQYPLIVKPTDRSGSRGVQLVYNRDELRKAIACSLDAGFEKKVLLEEYVEGTEYSVECLSYKKKHELIAVTRKYTSGNNMFIERGHLEPGCKDIGMLEKIRNTVFHALDSLEIENGPSHSEIRINENGDIKFIEIGARMGGDCIGSSLVELSTGIDFVKATIDIALGNEPDIGLRKDRAAAIRYIFNQDDLDVLNKIKNEHPEIIVEESFDGLKNVDVTDSSSRNGYYILGSDSRDTLERYMPEC